LIILNTILVHSPKFLVGAPYFLDQSKAVRNDPENYAEVLAHPPKHGGALKSQRSFPGIFPQKNALNAQNALHKNDPHYRIFSFPARKHQKSKTLDTSSYPT
jgi:hypothetical protein